MEHTCTRHQPGRNCYLRCRCRCERCRAADREYKRAYQSGVRLHTPAPDLDEVAWLLQMGEAPEIIAARMHSTVSAIARRARRLGHLDTARKFDSAAWADRRAAA